MDRLVAVVVVVCVFVYMYTMGHYSAMKIVLSTTEINELLTQAMKSWTLHNMMQRERS